jgi:hypothetical protein
VFVAISKLGLRQDFVSIIRTNGYDIVLGMNLKDVVVIERDRKWYISVNFERSGGSGRRNMDDSC